MIPIDNKMKTVNLGAIDIFFKDRVGILLINKKAIIIVKYGVSFMTSKFIL